MPGRNFGFLKKQETASVIINYIIDLLHKYGHAPRRMSTVGIKGRTVHRKKGNPIGAGDVDSIVRGIHFEWEVKAGQDRPSKAQLKRAKEVRAAGGYYFFIRSRDEFDIQVREYRIDELNKKLSSPTFS